MTGFFFGGQELFLEVENFYKLIGNWLFVSFIVFNIVFGQSLEVILFCVEIYFLCVEIYSGLIMLQIGVFWFFFWEREDVVVIFFRFIFQIGNM